MADLDGVAGHQGDGEILGEEELGTLLSLCIQIDALKTEPVDIQLFKRLANIAQHVLVLLLRQLGDLAAAHGQDAGVGGGVGEGDDGGGGRLVLVKDGVFNIPAAMLACFSCSDFKSDQAELLQIALVGPNQLDHAGVLHLGAGSNRQGGGDRLAAGEDDQILIGLTGSNRTN